MYADLLNEINEAARHNQLRQKTQKRIVSVPSPTFPDLWRAANHANVNEKSAEMPGCPHCHHCQSPLNPSLALLPFKQLLPSLQPHEPGIQFIYCISWLKSLSSAEENLPIGNMRAILESILEIERNEVADLTESRSGPSKILTKADKLPPNPSQSVQFTEFQQKSVKNKKPIINSSKFTVRNNGLLTQGQNSMTEDDKSRFADGKMRFNLRKRKVLRPVNDHSIITRAKKRERLEIQENDSAVDVLKSPEWPWDFYTSDLPSKLESVNTKKRLIPDSDGEATDCTPDMSFDDDFKRSESKSVEDSGIGDSKLANSMFTKDSQDNAINDEETQQNQLKNQEDLLKNCENRLTNRKNGEKSHESSPNNHINPNKTDTITSRRLSYIFDEFPITAAALKIVKSTLSVLEQEESIIYCWRETEIVINTIKTIVGFLDVVAVEEGTYPGYFDFFLKAIVQTIKNCVDGIKRDDLSVERTHHVTTILQFCNYRPICEEIISYLLEELVKLTDLESLKLDFNVRMQRDFKHYTLIDALNVTMEKYYNIVQCARFSSDLNHNNVKKLLENWGKSVRHYTKRNIKLQPDKVAFLRTIFYNLKISIQGEKIS